MNRHHIGIAAGLTLGAAASGRAQQAVPVHALGPIVAEARDAFGNINSIRALPDGRVLVNDASRHRLLLLDKSLGVASVVADSTPGAVNGHGSLPGALIPYAGDSTLFVDMASLSFLVVDPAGQIARVMSPPRPNDVMFLTMGSPGIDAQGRLTYRAMLMPNMPKRNDNGTFMMPEMPDSAPIFRVDLATRKVDTAAAIKIPKLRLNVTQLPNGGISATSEINPLPVADEWALMSDGAIALVRGQDYHIDWVNPDGTRTSTGKIPYDWQRLTDDDKVAVTDSARKALEAARASGGGAGGPMGAAMTVMTGGGDGGAGGGLNMVVRRGVADGPAPAPADGKGGAAGGPGGAPPPINMMSPSELPDYRPAFRVGAARPTPDDKLWIMTTAPAPSTPGVVYDVIDRAGELVDRVVVPTGRSVIGFGPAGDVYLTWRDGMGMHLARAHVH